MVGGENKVWWECGGNVGGAGANVEAWSNGGMGAMRFNG